MTPRRAFWEAVSTVAIASLFVWGILLYRVKPHLDEWPLYLLFFALPLFLVVPIYYRYRDGVKYSGKTRTPRYYLLGAIMYAVFFVGWIDFALRRHGWDRLGRFAIAFGFLLLCVDYLRRWMRARAALPPNDIHA